MESKYLVAKIREECKRKGITVSQLENQLGFSAGLISRWEKMNPSIDKIVGVADQLGVSLDELTGRNHEIVKNEGSFISELCEATEAGELEWKAYNREAPFLYPLECLGDIHVGRWDCGYCALEEGFVVIVHELVEEPEEIKIYVLPDEKSVPVLQKIDYETSLMLWECVSDKVEVYEDQARAEALKGSFIMKREKQKNMAAFVVNKEDMVGKMAEIIQKPENLKTLLEMLIKG